MGGLLATPTKVRVVGNAAIEGASAKTKNWAIEMGQLDFLENVMIETLPIMRFWLLTLFSCFISVLFLLFRSVVSKNIESAFLRFLW